jgi:hypothetical protein
MKHADLLTDKDRADLIRAEQLVEEGRKLRKQVFARLRARAFRRPNNA